MWDCGSGEVVIVWGCTGTNLIIVWKVIEMVWR